MEGICIHTKLGTIRKFSTINKKLRHMFDAAFVQSGMTGTQAVVLHFINVQGKYQNIYQRDIEAEFNIRRSSVTSVLQGLERNGFIVREGVKEDSRLKRLVLTDKASKIVEQLQESIDEMNQTILKGLKQDEIILLDTMLSHIVENLSDV